MEYPLPLDDHVRLAGPGLIALSSLLVASASVPLTWRLSALLTTLAFGTALWRRFLRRRPVCLRSDESGSLEVELAGGQRAPLQRVRLGVVGPRLLSAELVLEGEGRSPLLLTGRSVSAHAHWQLRRLLLDRRATQSSLRRGT